MSFGSKLRELRENKGLRQEDLGKLFNVGKSAVSQWENDVRIPDTNTIVQIAKYFGCSADYLLGLDSRIFSNNDRLNLVKLPILGLVRTGLTLMAADNIEDYLDIPEYLAADFILKVRSDSLIGAGILDGDLAICRETAEPRSGQIIAARKDISGEYSEVGLMYYFDTGGQPILRSANPNYPDIDYHAEGYTSVGHLTALIRRYAPGYDIYTDYLTIKNKEEWTEVMETAAEYGLTPQDILSSVNIQAKILKRLRGK